MVTGEDGVTVLFLAVEVNALEAVCVTIPSRNMAVRTARVWESRRKRRRATTMGVLVRVTA